MEHQITPALEDVQEYQRNHAEQSQARAQRKHEKREEREARYHSPAVDQITHERHNRPRDPQVDADLALANSLYLEQHPSNDTLNLAPEQRMGAVTGVQPVQTQMVIQSPLTFERSPYARPDRPIDPGMNSTIHQRTIIEQAPLISHVLDDPGAATYNG